MACKSYSPALAFSAREVSATCSKEYTEQALDRIALLNYREDGVTPYITVWKHGLSEMKV